MKLSPGTVVGANRWPYRFSACPGIPWYGVVLPINSIEAWAGTLRFGDAPAQDEVDSWIRHCCEQQLLDDVVPVRWEFGKVFWEPIDNLRGWLEDFAEWAVVTS